jgi:hypothetical protein
VPVIRQLFSLGLAIILLSAGQVNAQNTGNTGSLTLPGSSGQSSTPGTGQTCVQMQIAGQKPSPYDCLNQQLQQEVQGVTSTEPSLPLSAGSPPNQVGTFNEQSLSEQYGKNWGHSVIPYRPPPPVFSNGLHP